MYLYAIARKDIHMNSGKLSAQTGHAYTDTIEIARSQNPSLVTQYRNEEKGGSKVTLAAKKENDLIKAYLQLKELGVPCAVVVDRNHIHPPHFNGDPIITALGVGPCTQSEVKKVLKKFQVYKTNEEK